MFSRFAPPCMFYSPGENFDSPQDNATFYAGKNEFSFVSGKFWVSGTAGLPELHI